MGEASMRREKTAAKRGGVVRYRTLKLPGGKYTHIAITKKAGPKGGHTVAGTVHERGDGPQRMPPAMRAIHKDASNADRARTARERLRSRRRKR